MTVAFTDIRHGQDDGNVVEIKAGDDVKGLPEDVVDQLKGQGLIGDPPRTRDEKDSANDALAEENERLEEQVAELKAKLAAAEQEGKKSSTPSDQNSSKQ